MSDFATRLNAALEGRYRIERELGAGGMATVYLAKDLKHHRSVALKVLKPELAAVLGAERFLAEIKTTANLQHPHILPLFDSGEADSFLFYVMPYVQGDTLADRIDREKQLPVDEALGIATAVAGALQHAHDRGVIHRDIKPGNIMLQDGQPVVCDFGIALAVGAAGGARLTETGLSVGTPYYMSPEQATGEAIIGPPSDIYALGCVLYEMLIGEPPFQGRTAQAVLGKIILGAAPSATATRKSIPLHVDAAIRKALEKVPADRFTGANAFAKALADPHFRHGRDAVGTDGALVRVRRVAIAGWAVAVAAVAWLGIVSGRDAPQTIRGIERYADPFLEGQEPRIVGPADFELSPDGTALVYRHMVDGTPVLMVRRWDDLEATPIRGTEGGFTPAISPDGLSVAFVASGDVRVIPLAGGTVRTLANGVNLPQWESDGFVYMSSDTGVVRVRATGGAMEMVTRRSEAEGPHLLTDVLPDGRGALLVVGRQGGAWEIRSLDLSTGEMTYLLDGLGPRYISSGHLVYAIENETTSVMAVRFDPRRRVLLGTPIAVVDGVGYSTWSDDGTLFYAAGASATTRRLIWVDRSGAATPVDSSWTFNRGLDVSARYSISPDGSMIALREFTSAGYDIWVKGVDRGPRSRLTTDPGAERMPVWVPGGRDVTYLSDANGNYDVWQRRADGTGDPTLLVDIEDDIATVDWSPDGEWLLLRTTVPGTNDPREVLAFRPGTDSIPTPLFLASNREVTPTVSPDGRWIAYSSDETGRNEVYARPFPDVNAGRWQISIDGGRHPRWAHSGRELFFFDGARRAMMAVAIAPGTAFEAGRPSVLFEAEASWEGGGGLYGLPYDVHPDDQRFLFVDALVENADPGEGAPGPRVVLVKNMAEELRRLAP